MTDVVMYSTRLCPYCIRARRLLRKRGVSYEEQMLSRRQRDRLAELSGGGRTFPQIVVDGRTIGGFSELRGLERAGRLEEALKGVGP
jgi:glutaredoxin 3